MRKNKQWLKIMLLTGALAVGMIPSYTANAEDEISADVDVVESDSDEAVESRTVKGGDCSKTSSDNVKWMLLGSTLTISGTGEMADYDMENKAPWYSYMSSSDTSYKVVIKDGVTSVGSYAFYDCYHVISISLPDSLKKIGQGAFSDCESLTKLTIPAGVKTIKKYTFMDCTNLSKLFFEGKNTTFSDSISETFDDYGIILYGKHGSKVEEFAYQMGYKFRVKDGVAVSKKYYSYNGKSHKPSVRVTDEDGNLISSSKYKVTYSSGRKKIGTYSVKITFKSGTGYVGTRTAKFSVLPTATYFTNVNNAAFNDAKFTMKWKKRTKYVSGYQIEITDDEDCQLYSPKKAKRIYVTSNSKTSYRTYLDKCSAVRIRTYYKVNGKKVFSTWSGWYFYDGELDS